jgi:hypothetical protein
LIDVLPVGANALLTNVCNGSNAIDTPDNHQLNNVNANARGGGDV